MANGKNYVHSDNCATAPYNFVRVGERSNIEPKLDDTKSFSGTITCELTALTPLLVAGATPKKDESSEDPQKREFFKLNNGIAVIPGSSLKGMLRSYIEALSQSVVCFVEPKQMFYRDVTAKVKPNSKDFFDYKNPFEFKKINNVWKVIPKGGYLIKEGDDWFIYPVKVTQLKNEDEEDEESIYRTGLINEHRARYHFDPCGIRKYRIKPEVINRFNNQLENNEAQKAIWDENFNKLKYQSKGHRVFYITAKGSNEDIIEIGVACFLRRHYQNTPKDLFFKIATANETNDFALHLFGFTSDTRKYKGKVLIEPAYIKEKEENIGKTEDFECILSSPHPSCLMHYIKQPNVTSAQVDEEDKERILDYNTKATPRGRKFYWHREFIKEEIEKEVEHNDNPSIVSKLCPIKKGATAKFTIHLDKVNETELGAIIEALRMPQGHAFKLGSGKSCGLGSVEIRIEESNIFENSVRYKSILDRVKGNTHVLTDEEINQAQKAFRDHARLDKTKDFEQQDAIIDLRAMTDFNKKPANKLTQNMALTTDENYDLNFAKSRALLLDPKEVLEGNKFRR